MTSLVLRRHTRGRRRSDVPLAVVASPWHLLVGALATLAGLVLPLLVGISGVFSAALATVALTGGSPEPNAAAPLAVGALLALLVAWWGPGGSALRRGTRSVVRGVAPGRGSHVVVAGALLVAAGLGTWSYARHGTPVWWPWNTPAEVWQSGLACVDDPSPRGRPPAAPSGLSAPSGPPARSGLPARKAVPRRPRVPRALWRGEDVTETLPIIESLRLTPYRNPRVLQAAAEEREARASLDLALRVGELMLRCGAGAPQVESSVVAVAAAAGLDNLEVDITLQSLLVQCTTTTGGQITMLRVVRSATRDFARLVAVHEFVENLVAGSYDREAAAARLREIRKTPRFWPRWVVNGAMACCRPRWRSCSVRAWWPRLWRGCRRSSWTSPPGRSAPGGCPSSTSARSAG